MRLRRIANLYIRRPLLMKTHLVKTSLGLFGICLWLSGCSGSSDAAKPRWQIQTVEYTGGTNYDMLFKQPVLLDTQTGRTWALSSDRTNQCYVWTPFVVRNLAGQPVTP
jgi:hypothetical protein